MKKVYFWQLWDSEDLKGFLLIDLLFVLFVFLYFIPRIVHAEQGIGMTKCTPAQITNITTKGHIMEGRMGNYPTVDFYTVEYSYNVNGVQYKGLDLIPNSQSLQSFIHKLLHSRDTIFANYNPSHLNQSQLKIDK